MATTSWIINLIFLAIILFLNDDCSAADNLAPLLVRVDVGDEDGTTGFLGFNKNDEIIVEPNTKVEVSLSGYRFGKIEAVGFTLYDDCYDVSYIFKKDFIFHTENVVVIKYTFEPTKFLYKICIKQKPWKSYNGKLYQQKVLMEKTSIRMKLQNSVLLQTSLKNVVLDVLLIILAILFIITKLHKALTSQDNSSTGKYLTENDEQESEPPSKKSCTDSSINNGSKWYKIMSNQKYFDVILISSDKIEVPSHRCILAKYSKIFEKIIDEASELPVTINVENYNAEIIKAVLNFLYDKNDAINGKEMEVFKFALHYDIKKLMDACCKLFEESVDSTNVFDYIQIAYSNNFEELKQECLMTLVDEKKNIDALKFADLPKNVLSDFLTAL